MELIKRVFHTEITHINTELKVMNESHSRKIYFLGIRIFNHDYRRTETMPDVNYPPTPKAMGWASRVSAPTK